MVWGFAGDLKLAKRAEYFEDLLNEYSDFPFDLPVIDSSKTIIDYTVELETGEFVEWIDKVPEPEINQESVTSADTIVVTVDTLRH